MWIRTSLHTPHLHETRALAEPGVFRGNRPPIQSLRRIGKWYGSTCISQAGSHRTFPSSHPLGHRDLQQHKTIAIWGKPEERDHRWLSEDNSALIVSFRISWTPRIWSCAFTIFRIPFQWVPPKLIASLENFASYARGNSARSGWDGWVNFFLAQPPVHW